MDTAEPSFLGIILSTSRPKELGADAATYFQFEALIAAISILFFRTTVSLKREPLTFRWLFAILLAWLSYSKRSYELITAVEIFSFAVPFVFLALKQQNGQPNTPHRVLVQIISISASAGASLLLSHLIVTGKLMSLFSLITPTFVSRGINYLFPVQEFIAAYGIMQAFADPVVLQKQLAHLLFVTFHIQVGMGFLGIDFLRKEQSRRNQLIRLDVEGDENEEKNTKSNGSTPQENAASTKSERADRFQRGAGPFILFTALPYMFQIISYGNINKFAFMCVDHDMHRSVRLNQLFDSDSRLTAMAAESATSPDAYASSMTTVLETTYDIFNRKLFSLPKILLLPGVMSKQPMLVAQVFPFIMISDWIKANAISFMTTTIERLQKEMQELNSIRAKVESFDIKNAELLQRSGPGATRFTQLRWEELTVKVQNRLTLSTLLSRAKGFFAFIQRNFIFSVLIDCALANLIAAGKIMSSEIFVFSRAVEDAVDMLLMRSRGEAELARMLTEIAKLQELADIWERSESGSLVKCELAHPEHRSLSLHNLHYSRGTASAQADLVLRPGRVYALTGANGSGKSTLFRVLMSCDTNEKSIDLPPSILLHTPVSQLTNEEDALREHACTESDHNKVIDSDESGDCEAVVTANGETTVECKTATEGSPVLAPNPVPKLSITMPSSYVVEISQTFYWPLYSRPIDWIFQEDIKASTEESVLLRKVADELNSLDFFQHVKDEDGAEEESTSPEEATIRRIMKELEEQKEDWFDELSGGQKSKVELVRKVFLHDRCPDVLLVDETMAPLDPASKSVVMRKLKQFCSNSVMIVIYHTDVGQEEGGAVSCVPSNDFFDHNIHLEHGIVHLREIC